MSDYSGFALSVGFTTSTVTGGHGTAGVRRERKRREREKEGERRKRERKRKERERDKINRKEREGIRTIVREKR